MLLAKFKIKGHSMEPFLGNDRSVLASSLPFIFSEPKIDDVVVFRRKNKFFIKRITKKKGEKYYLQGDNPHDSLDSRSLGWVKRKDIVGKVIFRISG